VPKNSKIGQPATERDAEDIKTFDDAYRAGRDALKRIREAQVRGDKALLAKSQREAIRYLKLALNSVENDTHIEDVNVARFYLCYVYYAAGNYEKAAEVGEFLARRFPKHSSAPQAAKIAMAAHLNQYKRADGERKKPALTRLTSICRHIIETWPNDPIAAEAAQTLVMFALVSNKLDEAIANLKSVPEDARKRSDLELQIGQAIWRTALIELSKSPERDPSKPEDGKFVKQREQAKQLLESGIRRSKLDPKDPAVSKHVAMGALSLCQVYVHEKAFAKAVALLEDKTIGPHTLVTAKHPVASLPGFDVQTFMVATRAYRGIVESDNTDAETQKEAEGKLKQAIVELDKRRKASEEGRLDIDLTPPESDSPKRRDE
jgi:tetratricopeptide (TPR) repeat protein